MECKVRDLSMYYEEVGSGRPLVVLHGWSLDHRYVMNALEPVFSRRAGWRRIYVDLPGMGKTPGADWINTQEDMLDLLLEFIDTVAPGERFVVAASSYGATLARGIVYGRAAQMDGLMLSVPVIHADFEKRTLPKHRVVREDPDFLAALTSEEQSNLDIVVTQNLQVLDAFRASVAPTVSDQAFLARLRQNYGFKFDVDALPEPFPAPTLMVMGRQDHICGYHDAYKLLENYPRATFAVIDGGGHSVDFEKPAVFKALVDEWLDQVEAYAPTTMMKLTLDQLELRNVKAENVTYCGRKALRLVEDPENKVDGHAIAILTGSDFKDGVIETEIAGTTLPDAPPDMRGFVGIAFRVQPQGEAFECFYLRPTNGRANDQLRRNHATQYISHPDYPWYKLREEHPGVYESYADMLPGEWTKIRIVVSGTRAELYVNGADQPCLIVNDLKLGEVSGQIALWIGLGTDAYFTDVTLS